jgi:hypothetical protein
MTGAGEPVVACGDGETHAVTAIRKNRSSTMAGVRESRVMMCSGTHFTRERFTFFFFSPPCPGKDTREHRRLTLPTPGLFHTETLHGKIGSILILNHVLAREYG